MNQVEPKHLQGQVANLTLDVLQAMVNNQVMQGNPADVSVFQNKVNATRNEGGFDWLHSREGGSYWINLLSPHKRKDPLVLEAGKEYALANGMTVLIEDIFDEESPEPFIGLIKDMNIRIFYAKDGTPSPIIQNNSLRIIAPIYKEKPVAKKEHPQATRVITGKEYFINCIGASSIEVVEERDIDVLVDNGFVFKSKADAEEFLRYMKGEYFR